MQLPRELRERSQWLVSGSDKAPRSAVADGRLADVNNAGLYASFDVAYVYAQQNGMDVGFALTADDPFTVIDLDRPETDEQVQRHVKVMEAFDTYTELSRSGEGVHIWCKGSVPRGARRDKVEMYSESRYMICTGKPIKDLPVAESQEMLDILFEGVSNGLGNDYVELVERKSLMSDQEVFDMGMRAVNADKFDSLCKGVIDDYPSQSEADYALINILAYYTKSNSQVKRMFRMSALGQRDKAMREAYLDGMIVKIRSEEPPEIDFSQILIHQGNTDPDIPPGMYQVSPDLVPIRPVEVVVPSVETPVVNAPQTRISHPPGFVGEISRYIVDSSIRPVDEVGISAALGLCAGVLGRQFNISDTGLNQYIVLVAKTGVGKEGGASGIGRIMTAAKMAMPSIGTFIGPRSFASGPGIMALFDDQRCFVSVQGEFGLFIQNLNDKQGGTLQNGLRSALLDLYNKSGWNDSLEGSAYSDKKKNSKTIQSPAMSILGESTPALFYGGLSEQQIVDGLIPRFLIIEYEGDRPFKNKNAFFAPPEELLVRFRELAEIALRTQANNVCQKVELEAKAEKRLDDFNDDCDAHIRAGAESVRELWNRAHLKALRLAGLLAAAENPHNPVVNDAEALWAINLVTVDAVRLSARFAAGDVGEGVSKQHADLERILEAYLEKGSKNVGKHKVMQAHIDRNCVPYRFLQVRTSGLASYVKSRIEAAAALRVMLEEFVKIGRLEKLSRVQCKEEFGSHADVYHIVTQEEK